MPMAMQHALDLRWWLYVRLSSGDVRVSGSRPCMHAQGLRAIKTSQGGVSSG
jgi:hypothetical protein